MIAERDDDGAVQPSITRQPIDQPADLFVRRGDLGVVQLRLWLRESARGPVPARRRGVCGSYQCTHAENGRLVSSANQVVASSTTSLPARCAESVPAFCRSLGRRMRSE